MPELSYYTIRGKRETSDCELDCPIPENPSEGQIMVSTNEGINWQDLVDFQGSVLILCKATEPILKGQAVYINSAPTGIPGIALASSIEADSSRVIGIATSNIDINSNGYVMKSGILTDVDTTASNTAINPLGQTWSEGDLLFLATGGGLTNIRPTSGRSVKVGYNLRDSNQQGSILAYPMENPVWSTCANGENNVLRVGDNAGVNKVSIRSYDNTEIASINSLGNMEINGTINNIQVGNATHIQGIEVDDTNKVFDRILVYKTMPERFVFEAKPTGSSDDSEGTGMTDNMKLYIRMFGKVV
jgi:hypothetical protein